MMSDTDGGPTLAPKACDQCRRRKIRCDRINPCQACTTAGRPCSFSPKLHLQNPRQRILISRTYEEKVDQINVRVKEVEDSLRRLVSDANALQTHSSFSSKSSVSESDSDAVIGNTQVDDQNHDCMANDSVLSDDYTLQKQCVYAGEFLDSAILSGLTGRMPGSNPRINTVIATLKELAKRPKANSHNADQGQTFPARMPDTCSPLSQLSMPPFEVVSALLHHAIDGPLTLFSSNCALVGLTAADFLSLCTDVYVAPDEAPHSALTIVNAGLYYLFAEQSACATSASLEKGYASYGQLCQRNLKTCIRNFPLFSPDAMKQVQALLFGVTYAIDACWPSVAWYLNSAAAQLCQSAGFHRAKGTTDDESTICQTKRTLFWTAFTFDKCLSLRLGYASTIRETDITVPRDFNLNGVDQLGKGGLPYLWLITSSLRATTYERLYSPEALSCSSTEMAQRALEVGAECQAMEIEVTRICTDAFAYLMSVQQPEIIRLYITSVTVQLYTLLTLAYRMMPPPEGSPHKFSQECIEAARNAIRHHLNGVKLLGAAELYKAVYVNWTLMLTPFAPFFVLFCHVIMTLNPGDMDLLREFVASLNDLRSATPTAEKMYELCNAMWDVVCMCYDHTSTLITPDGQPQDGMEGGFGEEFDMFLNQLEFGLGGQQMPDIGDWFMGDAV